VDLILSPSRRRVGDVQDLLDRFLGDPTETGTAYLEYEPRTSPDRLEAEDLAYTLLMNSNVTGKTFRTLQEYGGTIADDLSALPVDVALEESRPDLRDAVADLICTVATWPHVKVSVATKLLHKKRPGLIPVLDNRAIFGAYLSTKWDPPARPSLSDSVNERAKVALALDAIYSDLTQPENKMAWLSLCRVAGRYELSPTRIEVLDMVWWRYFRDRESPTPTRSVERRMKQDETSVTEARRSKPMEGPLWIRGTKDEIVGSGDATVFVDDDDGYLRWIDANPSGFVLNCARSPRLDYLMLHRATCSSVRGTPPRGSRWTVDFIKVCARNKELVENWTQQAVQRDPSPCGRCRP